jgi:uncharacterized protein
MDKIALITGGSKGIGRALCDKFAQNGYNLILVARDAKALEQAKQEIQDKYKCSVKILSLDLEKRDSVDQIMTTFQKEMEDLDVLVNNAGFAKEGKFGEMTRAEIDGMMDVNMNTMVDLTYKVLPFMVARKRGKILNLGSTAAYTPGPYMAIYYATKAFVVSFSHALAEEYRKDGITVSVLCPGPTESGFFDRAGMRDALLLKAFKPMTAEKVAEAGYNGLIMGKNVIVPGFMNKLSVMSMSLSPTNLKSVLTARLNKVEEKENEDK